MKRPLAYISFDSPDNELEARIVSAKYCRVVYDAGYSPICPAIWYPLFLNRSSAVEYKESRNMANDLLSRSRVLIVCGGSDSEIVLEDIAIAKHLRIPTTTLDGIEVIEAMEKKRK